MVYGLCLIEETQGSPKTICLHVFELPATIQRKVSLQLATLFILNVKSLQTDTFLQSVVVFEEVQLGALRTLDSIDKVVPSCLVTTQKVIQRTTLLTHSQEWFGLHTF